MSFISRTLGLLLLLGLVRAGLCADIELSLRPAWTGTGYTKVTSPTIAELSNVGPSARGFLVVPMGSFTARVPVELPRGSTKRLVIYPELSGYPPKKIAYESNRGTVEAGGEIEPRFRVNRGTFGILSDAPGELSYLSMPTEERLGDPAQVFYCDPAEAPARYTGYTEFDTVFLGSGTERLPDSSIVAIRDFVLLGGTIVLPGGVPSPIHSDRRLAMLLPLSQIAPKSVQASSLFPGVRGDLTTLTGKLNPGTMPWREGRAYRRSFGLGSIIQLTFDPNDPVILKYKGRQSMLRKIISGATGSQASSDWNGSGASFSGRDEAYSGETMANTSTSRPFPSSSGSDPFSLTMPPSARILTILIAFFIIVVPVNLLVLRKMRRGEWAWVTAPVISILFAGYILSFGSDLYSAKLSRSTIGTLFAQAGSSEPIFVANTQMFIPKGGEYDPKIDHVLSVGKTGEEEFSFNTSQNSSSSTFDIFDGNGLRVASVVTTNLAFEELGYYQKFSNMPLFNISSNGKGYPIVQNLTSSDFKGRLSWKGAEWTIEAPAKSIGTSQKNTTQSRSLGFFLSKRNQSGVLTGEFDELLLGPQLGQLVKQRSRFFVVFCFTKEDIKPR